MFDGARARWDAAKRQRLRQVLDRLPDERIDEVGRCDEPDGLLFVTDQRLVLQDHDAMTEVSVPWSSVRGHAATAEGSLVRLVLELRSPKGEPDVINVLAEPRLVEAAGIRLGGGSPDD